MPYFYAKMEVLSMEELKEKLAEREKEFQEKYADIINDLCVKYGKDLGVGYDMLKAIARAKILGQEPLYSTNLEFDLEELLNDYVEIQTIEIEIHNNK